MRGRTAFVAVAAALLLAVDAANECIGTVAGDPSPLNERAYFVSNPKSVAAGPDGSVMVVDFNRATIAALDVATHSVSPALGLGDTRKTANGIPASMASINAPVDVVITPDGRYVFNDKTYHAVGIVNTTTGFLRMHADAGDAVYKPMGMALAADGSLFVASYGIYAIARLDLNMVDSEVVVGSGDYGSCDDGTAGVECATGNVQRVAIDPITQNLYYSDTDMHELRYLDRVTGKVWTVAGSASTGAGYSGDGGLATSALLTRPTGMAFTPTGDLYFLDQDHLIRKITRATGVITTVVGSTTPGFAGDWAAPTTASAVLFRRPEGLSYDPTDGGLLIADGGNGRVRKLFTNGTVGTLYAPASVFVDGMEATAAPVFWALSPVVLPNFDLLFAEWNGRIFKMSAADRSLKLIAGSGATGTPQVGDLATEMPSFTRLVGLAAAPTSGDIFFIHLETSDVFGISAATSRVFKVAGQGIKTTSAATPAAFAEGVSLANAGWNYPTGLLIAPQNESWLYVVDQNEHIVRRVDLAAGVVNTVAGVVGSRGYTGDGGPATSAKMYYPESVAADSSSGDLYIADQSNCAIRAVTLANGVMTTVLGRGTASNGCSGTPVSGTLATSIPLNKPAGVAVYYASASSIYLYAATSSNQIIWTNLALSAGSRLAYVLAGTGANGGTGDLGLATSASFSRIWGLAVDPAGNLYVGDRNNGRIRFITTGSATSCPAGHYCPCGQPVPCDTPGVFCPRNSLAPLTAGVGYWTFNVTGAASTDGARHADQQVCPRGSWCAGGVKTPCPAGTYGTLTRRWSPDQCSRCPVGTYLPERGATSLEQCLPCPPGFTSSRPGTAFCVAAKAGQVAAAPAARSLAGSGGAAPAASACANGTFALPGMTTCAKLPSGVIVTSAEGDTTVTTVDIPPPYTEPLLTPSELSLLQITVALPIVATGLIPAVIVLLRFLRAHYHGVFDYIPTSYASARNTVAGKKAVNVGGAAAPADGAVDGTAPPAPPKPSGLFVAMDLFSVKHALADYETMTKRRTPLGGACSLLALAVIAAMASALIVQFLAGNVLIQRSLLPATPLTVAASYPLPVATAYGSDVTPLAAAALPGLDSSLIVRVRAMGRSCATLQSFTQSGFVQGGFNVTSTAGGASFEATHTFACGKSCMMGPQTTVAFKLHPSCQALVFTVGAVGVEHEMTLVNFVASSETDVPVVAALTGRSAALASVDASLEVGLQRLEDLAVNPNITYRGFALKPLAVEVAQAPAPDAVSVTIRLPLATSLNSFKRTAVVSVAQLLSGLIGLFGILGGMAAVFANLEKFGPMLVAFCKRRREAKKLMRPPTAVAAAAAPPKAIEAAVPEAGWVTKMPSAAAGTGAGRAGTPPTAVVPRV